MSKSNGSQDITFTQSLFLIFIGTSIAGFFGGSGWAIGIFSLLLIGAIGTHFESRKSFKKIKNSTKLNNTEKDISISVTTSTSYTNPFQEPINLGAVKKINESEYLINPNSTLPITVKNISLEIAKKFSDVLGNMPSWEEPSELTYLISTYNLQFPQIDELISEIGPGVEISIMKKIKNSKEWQDGDELDREDLKTEFTIDAIESSGYECISDDIIETLIFGKPTDITADDAFLKAYSGDKKLLHFYVFQIGRGSKLTKIEADSHARSTWNALVKSGLALQGKDIPIELLASKLKVKEINEMFSDRLEKNIRLKADAISFAVSQPDLIDMISKKMKLRELFIIKDPDNVDIDALASCYRYASAQAKIVQDTHNRCIRIEQTKRLGKPNSTWTIEAQDCCKKCAPLDGKEFKSKPKNLPPYHIGCNCRVDVYSDY